MPKFWLLLWPQGHGQRFWYAQWNFKPGFILTMTTRSSSNLDLGSRITSYAQFNFDPSSNLKINHATWTKVSPLLTTKFKIWILPIPKLIYESRWCEARLLVQNQWVKTKNGTGNSIWTATPSSAAIWKKTPIYSVRTGRIRWSVTSYNDVEFKRRYHMTKDTCVFILGSPTA